MDFANLVNMRSLTTRYAHRIYWYDAYTSHDWQNADAYIRPALASLAYKLDQTPLSQHGRNIENAILLGPTLFPLAFAALGGRSLKKIALWKAERGTTLGVGPHFAAPADHVLMNAGY